MSALWPKWRAAAVALAASALASGCVGRRSKVVVQCPCAGVECFQECPVRTACYKSPQLRAGQDSSLALAAAISGGGLRSGNFAAGVLLGLEGLARGERGPANALKEVDYFSTVSGGGFAAAAYVASLGDSRHFGSGGVEYSFRRALLGGEEFPPGREPWDPRLIEHLRGGYHWNIIHGALALTGLSGLNRGDYLEQALDDKVLGRSWRRERLAALPAGPVAWGPSLTLRNLFVGRDEPRAVRLPQWVTNATVFENGAIFPFTPDHLALYEVTGYVHDLEPVADPRPLERRRGRRDGFARRAPLSLGFRASTSFPVLIAAATLASDLDPKYPYVHVLDGGMVDNLGTTTALRMLRDETHPAVRRKALIVIDAYKDTFTPLSKHRTQPRPFATAFRVTVAHLDSYRGRSHEMVRALCRSSDFTGQRGRVGAVDEIQLVFLSFDDLIDVPTSAALKPYGLTDRSIAALKSTGRTPFEMLRAIWSSFEIKPAQQELLLAAGQYVVHKKRDEILAALGWSGCGAATRPAACGRQPSRSRKEPLAPPARRGDP